MTWITGVTTGAEMASSFNELSLSNDGVAGGVSKSVNRFFYKSKEVTSQYVVVGDSTRNSQFNEMPAYYSNICGQLGIDYENQALSGLKMSEYLAGTRAISIDTTIAAILGTGENTLIEFSMGINDSGLETTSGLVALIKSCIDGILLAKPNTTVVLCQPVRSAGQRQNLNDAYSQVANERGYPLLPVDEVTIPVHGDSRYYTDDTHPNKYGSMRVVNYIFNKILPTGVRDLLLLPDSPKTPPPDGNITFSILNGLYSGNNGAFFAIGNHRTTSIFDVEPNFVLDVIHSGNQRVVTFYDQAGAFISSVSIPSFKGQPFRNVTVPVGAYKAAVNISNDGAGWDAIGEEPIVKYSTNLVYLRQRDINIGFSMTLAVEQSGLIDKFGFTGEDGQIAVSDGQGDWRWATI